MPLGALRQQQKAPCVRGVLRTPRRTIRSGRATIGACSVSVGGLDEVVAREDVEEGDQRHDREDRPAQLGDEADVVAEEQVDPDQDDRNRVQDAEDQLEQFLHGSRFRSRWARRAYTARSYATACAAQSRYSSK